MPKVFEPQPKLSLKLIQEADGSVVIAIVDEIGNPVPNESSLLRITKDGKLIRPTFTNIQVLKNIGIIHDNENKIFLV